MALNELTACRRVNTVVAVALERIVGCINPALAARHSASLAGPSIRVLEQRPTLQQPLVVCPRRTGIIDTLQ